MAKHNWAIIKKEYVEAPDEKTRPTLEELAARYKCSPSYLRERASKEGWKVEAERFLQTVSDKRQEQKSTALAGELAQWDAQCFKLAQAGMNQVFLHLKIAHDHSEKYKEPYFGSIKDLEDLAKTIERFQKIGKTALGEEEKSTLNVKIDYSKLSDEQLERLAQGEDPRNVIAA